MRRFLFVLGSTRTGGNSELLAHHAADHLPPEVPQRWLRLADLQLSPLHDVRHTGDGRFAEPTGHERTLLDATLHATDLVIVSPLYWYSVTWPVKLYLDYWTAWLELPDVRFKERMAGGTLYAITAHTSADPSFAEPLVGMLRLTAEYLRMRWGGAVLGYGDRPEEILADADALARAASLFGAAATPVEGSDR